MKRYDDIIELLSTVENAIDLLKQAYASAAKDENIKSVLRPLVKSSLEHLRSCLEYCAQDTHERLFGGSRRLYFPYGNDERHFNDSVANNLPNLQKRSPPVYDLYAGLQPHRAKSDWLTTLCTHTNFNKHNSLTKPERVNSPEQVLKVGNLVHMKGGGGTVTFENCFVDGHPVGFGKPLVIDSKVPTASLKQQLPVHIKVEREFSWVEFRFPGSVTDALTLISKGHTEIDTFTRNLKSLLS